MITEPNYLLAEQSGHIPVAWRDRPFDGKFHRYAVPFRGKPPTITEVLDALDGLPTAFKDVGEVRFNGDMIDCHHWHRVRPREGVVVTLHMPIRGGGSGGGSGGSSGGKTKNPIATIATIGVLLAATAITAGALGPAGLGLLGTTLGTGIGAALLGSAVGIGGALLVNALFPPPTTAVNNAVQPVAPTPAGRALGPASLQGNALSPGAAVPRVIGTMRIFPPVLSPQLIEIKGGVEHAEVVFGLAGPHSISTVQADGIDVTQLPQLTMEIQEGLNTGVKQSLVQRQGVTIEPNITLSSHQLDPNAAGELNLDPSIPVALALPQWQQFITRIAPDECWIQLEWPGGLVNTSSSTVVTAMPIRLQIRPTGTNTWINLPELHYQRKPTSGTGTFITDIRLLWQPSPNVIVLPPLYNSSTGWSMAFKHIPPQTTLPAGVGWNADPYFSAGAGNDVLVNIGGLIGSRGQPISNVQNVTLTSDSAIIYLDPAVFPPGQYDIQIKRGIAYNATPFAPATYTYTGFTGVIDFTWYQTSTRGSLGGPGGAAVDASQDSLISDVNVKRIVSVWNDNPIQSSDFATLSMRIFNRSLANISVLASGYTYDLDDTGWNTITTTSNPAPHFRDVLIGALGGAPIPLSIVDNGSLVTWREACNAQDYQCNMVVEGKTYVDVLNAIASCGYARRRSSETWGVIRDYDRRAEAPVQIFTPRNMTNFKWTKAFAKFPSGFRVTYTNEAINYAQDSTIIYADPNNVDNSNLEAISYDGLVTSAEVSRRGAYDLQQAKSRFTFYSGDADIESLVCQRGDLVGVQYDTLDTKAGFARIRSVIVQNNLVTGLKLEGSALVDVETDIFSSAGLFNETSLFNLGSRTGIAIRLKGGSGVLIKEVTASPSIANETDMLTFVTPFADPGTSALDNDCLCTFGSLGSEYRRLIVDSIMPKDDMTSTITFVDEAPELWPPLIGTVSGSIVSSDDDASWFTPGLRMIPDGFANDMITEDGFDMLTEDGDVLVTVT